MRSLLNLLANLLGLAVHPPLTTVRRGCTRNPPHGFRIFKFAGVSTENQHFKLQTPANEFGDRCMDAYDII